MDFVEQVKSSVDIVKVVGEYVRLRKAGPTRYVGLCPFHNEKSPSFGVNTLHQFYKCFGCGAGGDVFKFVMAVQGISFFEALKSLAETNGIPMPKRSEYSDPDTRLRGALLQMHEIAAQAYCESLRSDAGAEARSYLSQRGVAPEAIAEFGLGYSDTSGRHLLRILEARNFTSEQLEASGLISTRQDGGFYDRFRNRLMFPIHNEAGKVIAFGGRALKAGDEPKYLNSAETPIYTKSQVLYNLHRAKQSIRKSDRSVMVEGYMDAIGVWSAGISEVVAVCGTALSSRQIQSLKRHSLNIVVNFDSDAAGGNATERYIQTLLEEGMRVRVLELAGGLDPDEYCKEHGAAVYREELGKAKSYFYWLADRARSKFDMKTAEGRVGAFQFLLPSIRKISEKIERVAIVNDVAGYLGVEAGLVLDNFRKAAGERGEKKMSAAREPARAVERILLNLLLTSEEAQQELIPQLRSLPAIDRLAMRRIFQALCALFDSGRPVNYGALEARLEENDREILAAEVLADETAGDPVSLSQGVACVQTLENAGRETLRAELKSRIKDAERAGNMEEALRLYAEFNRMARR